MARYSDKDLQEMRDGARIELALQAIKDIFWRFNEQGESDLSISDLLGCLMEELLREGFCPACMSELLQAACERTESDPAVHRGEDLLPNLPDGKAVH